MKKESILSLLPMKMKIQMTQAVSDFDQLREIRIRAGKPVFYLQGKEEHVLKDERKQLYIADRKDLQELLEYATRYSMYACEEEMRHGFLTVEGGHRIGIAGGVIRERDKVKNIRYISSVNIRIAHEIQGCADKIMPYITEKRQLLHTLIVSAPGRGKTTLLRDIIRQASDGSAYVDGKNVGVVDERSEIGGCYRGIAQNHIGDRTDILDGCSKPEGMLMLIRSMAPEVIAVDEIGTDEDVQAVEQAMLCGCKILATIHAGSMEELQKKRLLEFLTEHKRFERYIVLSAVGRPGEPEGVYDECGKKLA